MSERDQLKALCGWNQQQVAEIRHLRREVGRLLRRTHELEAANTELKCEREATEVLIGAAMDAGLEGGGS